MQSRHEWEDIGPLLWMQQQDSTNSTCPPSPHSYRSDWSDAQTPSWCNSDTESETDVAYMSETTVLLSSSWGLNELSIMNKTIGQTV